MPTEMCRECGHPLTTFDGSNGYCSNLERCLRWALDKARLELKKYRDLADAHEAAETSRRAPLGQGGCNFWTNGGSSSHVNCPVHHAPGDRLMTLQIERSAADRSEGGASSGIWVPFRPEMERGGWVQTDQWDVLPNPESGNAGVEIQASGHNQKMTPEVLYNFACALLSAREVLLKKASGK